MRQQHLLEENKPYIYRQVYGRGEGKGTNDILVISRCDIMLVMEIKDTQNKTCPFLMEKLNSLSKGTEKEFKYVISERLGRKTYKEQYAFIYRPKLVSVKQTYQYPDRQPGDEDAFSREPFVVWFQAPRSAVTDFVIIPQHTTPETAVREIDELYDVYLAVKQKWKSKPLSPIDRSIYIFT
ncbi:deoxyribonuclease gamma-like [Alligator sinensis]|uniref:Deoxyribonuclease gamma-like n=1 Tax=Alligator sinensis TaxID=38654 RepID=A0A3Q0FSN1_ALLSI|nr:deoxyribonuclease gamma-like [Alligator sinensis]